MASQSAEMANAWSPEQIARRLPVDFLDDETMRISHEAIYPGAVRARAGRIAPRADGLLTQRPGIADAAGAHAAPGQELHRA